MLSLRARRQRLKWARLLAAMKLSPEAMELFWQRLESLVAEKAWKSGAWAGIPSDCSHHPLVLEPRYPHRLPSRTNQQPWEWSPQHSPEVINCWHSRRGLVVLLRGLRGRVRHVVLPEDRLSMLLGPLGVFSERCWNYEAELTAQRELQALVGEYRFQAYMLTGMFLETSPRSGVTYVFRRLAPTLALRPNKYQRMRVLTSLCLHPIGYYRDTSAGAMVPTDDVLCNLLLMRADERRYWAKANQHPPTDPRARFA